MDEIYCAYKRNGRVPLSSHVISQFTLETHTKSIHLKEIVYCL